MTPVRPEHADNKCIVISRLNLDMTPAQFKNMINARAKREIDCRYIHNLSRDYSSWRTIAIELNSEDYDTLINPSFWERTVRIREFIGPKTWRGERRRWLSSQQIRNSVRSTWQ